MKYNPKALQVLALMAFTYSLVSGGRAQEATDDGSLCGPAAAEPQVHECHCHAMVEAVQQMYQEECDKNSRSRKEREACLSQRPNTCDVMDRPGGHGYRDKDGEVQDASEHPDQCLKRCHKEKCECNEHACSKAPKH